MDADAERVDLGSWTPEQQERLLTLIIDPSPVTRFCFAVTLRCYVLGEKWAGVGHDYDPSTMDFKSWPWHARWATWIGSRSDDLGLWVNRRRAARRLRKRAI